MGHFGQEVLQKTEHAPFSQNEESNVLPSTENQEETTCNGKEKTHAVGPGHLCALVHHLQYDRVHSTSDDLAQQLCGKAQVMPKVFVVGRGWLLLQRIFPYLHESRRDDHINIHSNQCNHSYPRERRSGKETLLAVLSPRPAKHVEESVKLVDKVT